MSHTKDINALTAAANRLMEEMPTGGRSDIYTALTQLHKQLGEALASVDAENGVTMIKSNRTGEYVEQLEMFADTDAATDADTDAATDAATDTQTATQTHMSGFHEVDLYKRATKKNKPASTSQALLFDYTDPSEYIQ